MAYFGKGSIIPYDLHLTPMGNTTLEDAEWNVTASAGGQFYNLHKSKATKIDENTYTIFVDTSMLNVGEIELMVCLYVVDPRYPSSDGLREEYIPMSTGDSIIVL